MDRNGDLIMTDDGSQANIQYVVGDEQPPILTSSFFLDHVGEVFLTLKPDGLSWKLMESLCNVSFPGYIKLLLFVFFNYLN
ncbi:hypothetical protein Hdeb2414_s0023g00642311 [Helianthus debilis subsp. tardiflorus]